MDERRPPPTPQPALQPALQNVEPLAPAGSTPAPSAAELSTAPLPTTPLASTLLHAQRGDLQAVARLELREERAHVEKDRFVQQHLNFRREVRTRTETHTAELRSEVLVIGLAPGEAAVRIGDHLLQPGENYELLLYNERLRVEKQPYLSEVVEIGKQMVSEARALEVQLDYEVLTVEEGPGLVRTLIPPEENEPPRERK